MGFTAPRNLPAFVLAICVAITGIVLLGLDGQLNGGCGNANGNNSNFTSLWCAATGVGIAAGVLGLVIGLLAIFWLLVEEMFVPTHYFFAHIISSSDSSLIFHFTGARSGH